MIETEAGLRQTEELLSKAREVLAAIPKEHPNAHPQWIALFSEGLIEQIKRFEQEIEEYTGEPVAQPPDPTLACQDGAKPDHEAKQAG